MTCSVEVKFTETEVHMNLSPAWRRPFRSIQESKTVFLLVLLVPVAAHAQALGGSPFDTGFSAMQNLFTGTVAKVASLIAIVVGGYQFAHGEPGAKKTATVAVAGGKGAGACLRFALRIESRVRALGGDSCGAPF